MLFYFIYLFIFFKFQMRALPYSKMTKNTVYIGSLLLNTNQMSKLLWREVV